MFGMFSFSSISPLFILLQILLRCSQAFRSYDGYRLIRAFPSNPSHLSALRFLSNQSETSADPQHIQFWRLRHQLDTPTDIFVSPEGGDELERFLHQRQIPYYTANSDFGHVMSTQFEAQPEGQSRADQSAPLEHEEDFDVGRYHPYDEIIEYLKRLNEKYPNFVRMDTIGKSFEGRSIPVLILGYPPANGTSTKPALLMDAGIHAREWIAPAVALQFIHALIHDPEYHQVLKKMDCYIIPVLNPDGYAYTWTDDRLWRVTRSGPRKVTKQQCPGLDGELCFGADPNRNFPYHWDESGTSPCPCSEVYRGEHPLSEIECDNLAKFMQKKKDVLEAYLSCHSYGELIIHAWNYKPGTYPDNVEKLRSVGNAMVKAMVDAGCNPYTVGSGPDILYAASGGSDDHAQNNGVPLAFTMELTSGTFDGQYGGFVCPENKINSESAKILPGILRLAEEVAKKAA